MLPKSFLNLRLAPFGPPKAAQNRLRFRPPFLIYFWTRFGSQNGSQTLPKSIKYSKNVQKHVKTIPQKPTSEATSAQIACLKNILSQSICVVQSLIPETPSSPLSLWGCSATFGPNHCSQGSSTTESKSIFLPMNFKYL